MKPDQRGQVRRETVIALVDELVAIGDELVSLRIEYAGIIHQRPPGDRVAIGSGNRHQVAESCPIGVESQPLPHAAQRLYCSRLRVSP